ncbi:DNA-binding cell division cycle control protein [Trachipleistophora hominis]|uniref:DNA-binding cell division cycle control protein n=1 Tax=Trachipleistophora hominis TaxID=72359 RepID=L7JYY1_TRAHO|nr:DNA-binding cell division cycle control protein [Trachipleistophora hominis]
MYVQQIKTALKYKNYTQAIFVLTHAAHKEETLKLILGIVLYENREYYRALSILSSFNTITGMFYAALCHREMKNYADAIDALLHVINGDAPKDTLDACWADYVLDGNSEHVCALLGELYTLNEQGDDALVYYRRSVGLYAPFMALFYERALDEHVCARLPGFFAQFAADLLEFERCSNMKIVHRYAALMPGIGTYFVSNAARVLFEHGDVRRSVRCFESVHKNDGTYTADYDSYSAALWLDKNVSALACVCRTLLDKCKHVHVTWCALANYFSLRNDHNRSVLCLKKSLNVRKTAYAYLLLGHESIIRNEYEQAQLFFFRALKMHRNNYNALFGIALVFSKTDQIENADVFFRKAVEVNGHNKVIRYLYVKYLVDNKKYEKAVDVVKAMYGVEGCELGALVGQLTQLGCKDEYDELVMLEMVDVLVYYEMVGDAQRCLDGVNVRGAGYRCKKDLVDKMIAAKENKAYVNK